MCRDGSFLPYAFLEISSTLKSNRNLKNISTVCEEDRFAEKALENDIRVETRVSRCFILGMARHNGWRKVKNSSRRECNSWINEAYALWSKCNIAQHLLLMKTFRSLACGPHEKGKIQDTNATGFYVPSVRLFCEPLKLELRNLHWCNLHHNLTSYSTLHLKHQLWKKFKTLIGGRNICMQFVLVRNPLKTLLKSLQVNYSIKSLVAQLLIFSQLIHVVGHFWRT